MKGLVVAALAAAIVSSLASMLNSTSTIFTMDIYKVYINPKANDRETVRVGRISAMLALIIACVVAPLLRSVPEMFQYIQEYTGVVSPGILAVFMMGLFVKKATNRGAIMGVLASIPIALYFKVAPKEWSDHWLFLDLPFLTQMMTTFILSMLIIFVVSVLENKGKDDPKGINLSSKLFATGPAFNIGAFVIMIMLVAVYALFW